MSLTTLETVTINPVRDTAADLLAPASLGGLQLANRVVMAPLTRNRAGADGVPQDINAAYYAQRASAGLIITEGSPVSAQGVGYPGTPGIFTDDQVAGWKRVTDAVHGRDGHIFLQLWHVGRISHPSLQPGGAVPVAPSAVRPTGDAFTEDGLVPFVRPHALEADELPGIVARRDPCRQRLPVGPVPARSHQPTARRLWRARGKPGTASS
jgi:N-ethylmaleimide reductase